MIKHCHIAEPEKRAYPSLAKDSDCVKATYKNFLDVMSAAGCDTCSIEARTDDFCNDVADAIALLRNL
jgi:hypothetical protein